MENCGVNEIKTIIESRAFMYRFLARLYREEADQDLLNNINEIKFPFEETGGELGNGFRLLRDAVQGADDEQAILDLAIEFTRLFLGAVPDGAFPYESVYTSKKGLVMQEAQNEILAIYCQEGLERSDSFPEPEDHLALELEFMGHLCQRIEDALQENDHAAAKILLEKQKAFLEQHLNVWLDPFCKDVFRLGRIDFYKAAAMITRGYIQIDGDLIPHLLNHLSLWAG